MFRPNQHLLTNQSLVNRLVKQVMNASTASAFSEDLLIPCALISLIASVIAGIMGQSRILAASAVGCISRMLTVAMVAMPPIADAGGRTAHNPQRRARIPDLVKGRSSNPSGFVDSGHLC